MIKAYPACKKRVSLSSATSVDAGGGDVSFVEFRSPAKSRITSGQSWQSVTLVNSHSLDEKQMDMFKDLQNELQDLKYENNELKFLLFVALKHVDGGQKPQGDEFQVKLESLARDFLEDSTGVKNMQLELDSTTAMLEEARWVQDHYENRFKEQELKIEELKKQVRDYRSREILFMKQQLPPTEIRTSRTAHQHPQGSPSRRRKHSVRQRSLSTTGQHRSTPALRGSALPDNYKETVATLPPILSGPSKPANEVTLWMHRVKKAKQPASPAGLLAFRHYATPS